MKTCVKCETVCAESRNSNTERLLMLYYLSTSCFFSFSLALMLLSNWYLLLNMLIDI